MFEHTEGDMEELSHDGADDAHFWFASSAKGQKKIQATALRNTPKYREGGCRRE
jgi:hypothetical protein